MSNGHACCLLAVCCPPGSAAQRRSLKHWLMNDVLAEFPMTDEARERKVENHLDALPWGTTAADFDADGHRLPAGPADSVGEAV